MSGEGGEGEGEGHNLAQGGRERGGEGGEGDKEGVIEKTGKDSNTATTTTTGWMDTHPSSTDRFKWLSEQVSLSLCLCLCLCLSLCLCLCLCLCLD